MTSGGKRTIGRFSVPDSPESGDRALLRDKACVIQCGEMSISMREPLWKWQRSSNIFVYLPP
jgi:hypothetical protein